MCHLKDDVGFWEKSPLKQNWEGETSYPQIMAITPPKNVNTLLGTGGADMNYTYLGLWELMCDCERNNSSEMSLLLSRQRLCKIIWTIRKCLTHYSLKIASLFGSFGVGFKEHLFPPINCPIFSGLSVGLGFHSNPINSV